MPQKTTRRKRGEQQPEMEDFKLLDSSDFNHIKLTPNQLTFFKTIKENFVTVCTGPAGTAKTFVACYAALELLKEGAHKKIILARPAVESGEQLGFLPGTMDEKIAPYMEGYLSNMEKILKYPNKLKMLVSTKDIDMQPLAFMRGKTFDNTILILDEAQNADLRQIMLVVTRMGMNSRIVICGDVTQWDVMGRRKDLLTFADKIAAGVKDCAAFQFLHEDIVRNPMLIQLTDNYEKYKYENNIE